jgi:hypothetical protein
VSKRRGRLVGPLTYWMALLVLMYALTSGAVAVATLNRDCDDRRLERHWNLVPPGWDCHIKRTTFKR